MKIKQLIVVGGGLLLFTSLFFFGKTIPPKDKKTVTAPAEDGHTDAPINFNDLLVKAKARLTAKQSEAVVSLENSIVRGDIKEQKIHVFHQLAKFWRDTAKVFEPYAYYTAEAAKLENSEKSLTFAAQLFIDNLFDEGNHSMQAWLANNGKVLLEKALELNPNNDSSKIGLGACYILGNISDQPMQGILPVREIAEKNPKNLYAQWVLALGGKKSGQFDKAIERFAIIVQQDTQNLGAMLHLAECYDLKGDIPNAIKWYKMVQSIIPNPEAKKELQNRIDMLGK
ncbi:MAG: tetratricopeptide repeat protein [Flavobacterium sp.]|nr:tetratricopeptide repeat protein [Flavobacterium sp.]